MALRLVDYRIKNLSDEELISRVKNLARQERQIIESLIWHLQEVQDRKLFITMGFTSLYECLVKHFNYSEAVAYQRISALKIISTVPEAAKALTDGEVTLTALSLTQTFIAKQEKESGAKLCAADKMKFLEAVKNKSTRDVKQTLAEMNPALELPADKINYLTATDVQLLVTTDKSLLEKIEKLKSLISHENISPTYSELLHTALDAAIEKKEKAKGLHLKLEPKDSRPLKNITQGNSVKSDCEGLLNYEVAETDVHSRYVSREVKRQTLSRSSGHCEFIHKDGSRCDSRFQLQFDHIHPFSLGGDGSSQNIQILCRVHNALKANKLMD